MVARKTAVKPCSFPVSSPNMTINPEPIPIRPINKCKKVYVAVAMPKIMIRFLSIPEVACVLYDSLIEKSGSCFRVAYDLTEKHVRRSVWSIQFAIKLAVANALCWSQISGLERPVGETTPVFSVFCKVYCGTLKVAGV